MNRLVVALFMVPLLIRAQTTMEEGVKFSLPVLNRAPANSEWTVSFFQDRQKVQEKAAKDGLNLGDGDAAGDSSAPKSLTITKNGVIYREVLRKGNGQVVEKWSLDGLQVYKVPQSEKIFRAVLPVANQFSDTYSDYRRSDFENFEWITKDNFVGIKDVAGRKVFEFRVNSAKRTLTPRERSELIDTEKTPVDLASVQAPDTGGFTAYLDIRTQLPVYFDDGQIVRVYSFSTTPAAQLVPPPEFANEIATWKKELDRRKPLPKP